MTFKDKHQKKNEQQEFSRTSRQWIIHPKYNQAAGNNYDLCLVKLDQSLNLITGTSAKMIFSRYLLVHFTAGPSINYRINSCLTI